MGGYAISYQNNLKLHLDCHTCWLSYFTLVCLWCRWIVGWMYSHVIIKICQMDRLPHFLTVLCWHASRAWELCCYWPVWHPDEALQELKSRVNMVSGKCEKISAPIESFEDYSFNCNLKIVAIWVLRACENTAETFNLCLRLFSALGVRDVPFWTAHPVSRMKASISSV